MQNRTRLIVKAFIVSGLKGLAISLAIALPGLALMVFSPTLGMIWLFVGSFAQIAWSYRREWRVMWITTLLPPVAAGLAWVLQVLILGIRVHPALVLGGVLAGLALGALCGVTHRFRVDEKGIHARKTIVYLAFWVLCSLVTQVLAHFGQTRLAGITLVTGAFSTAILAGISGVIILRFLTRLDDLRSARAGVAA